MNSEKNLFHCHFVNLEPHMTSPGIEPGSPLREASGSAQWPELRYGLVINSVINVHCKINVNGNNYN
jgi:hypothetical protein